MSVEHRPHTNREPLESQSPSPQPLWDVRLGLFEPDIAANFGAVLRLAACLGSALEVIEPAGFPFDDRRLRRTAMDYAAQVAIRRHVDFGAFNRSMRSEQRPIVLFSTKAQKPYHHLRYPQRACLLFGSETRGVPEALWHEVDDAVRIPLIPSVRSLNLVTAAAIGLAEAARQQGRLDALQNADAGRRMRSSPAGSALEQTQDWGEAIGDEGDAV